MICTFTRHYSGDQNKENEMDWACGTCGGEEKCIPIFGGEF